jgi:site-specific DNA-methyltransferase (adenine-specific)
MTDKGENVGKFKLYNGDCLEVMKEFADESIDMILCDLPYQMTNCSWDVIIPLEPLWRIYNKIIKDNGAIVLTCNQPFTSMLVASNPKHFRYELIWAKNRGTNIFNAKKMPMKAHENILVFYKKLPVYNAQMTNGKPYKAKQGKQSDAYGLKTGKEIITVNEGTRYPLSVLNFNTTNGRNLHPTEKPVDMLEWLIKTYTNEGDLVLDNTFGSCSTGEACLLNNRRFVGIEKDEKYFNIGVERLKNVCDNLNGKI